MRRVRHGDEIRHEGNLQRRPGKNEPFVPPERRFALEKHVREIFVGREKGGKAKVERPDADPCQIEMRHDHNPNC